MLTATANVLAARAGVPAVRGGRRTLAPVQAHRDARHNVSLARSAIDQLNSAFHSVERLERALCDDRDERR